MIDRVPENTAYKELLALTEFITAKHKGRLMKDSERDAVIAAGDKVLGLAGMRLMPDLAKLADPEYAGVCRNVIKSMRAKLVDLHPLFMSDIPGGGLSLLR